MAFINRVAGLYTERGADMSRSWIYRSLSVRWRRGKPEIKARTPILDRLYDMQSSDKRKQKRFPMLRFAIKLALVDIKASFAWDLLWLNTLGLIGVLFVGWRWQQAAGWNLPEGIAPADVEAATSSLGFGQTVSLLLLLLPVMTAEQVFYGK
ncbi:hypothetical protein BX600DRAFT_515411 [Xylariales sp. PMI_506]|nr:hypothetical protein BX600DRAFT_515411 [Xylariales sp. PMI_506]